MATGVASFTYTLVAGADLEGMEYHAIGIDSTGRANMPDAIPFGGIAQTAEDIGRAMTIMKSGISIVRYGDDVDAGDELTFNTDGELIPIGILTTPIVAIALASGSAGELHSALLV